MSLMSNLVSNILAARQLDELRAMREEMAQRGGGYNTPQYDWQDPEFQGATVVIRDDFYARHLLINTYSCITRAFSF